MFSTGLSVFTGEVLYHKYFSKKFILSSLNSQEETKCVRKVLKQLLMLKY